jgi:GNAT superfamily N-acetyltransferase
MFLCVTVYAAVKRPRWLALALGLFLASKQFDLLALPLVGILLRPFAWKAYWRLLGWSVAIAVATLLPFAFPHPGALWHDLALFHIAQPFRPDALSFGVVYPPYRKIGLLLLLAFLAWNARRGAGRPALFSAAFGIALLLFFSAGKQAWMNYYFLIGQSLLLAAAMLWPASTADAPMPDQKVRADRSPHQCAHT